MCLIEICVGYKLPSLCACLCMHKFCVSAVVLVSVLLGLG